MEFYDSQTGIPYNCSYGARCVQKLDDSQIHANRITFRISLRSSSLQEPRDPLLKVVNFVLQTKTLSNIQASMYRPPCDRRSMTKARTTAQAWGVYAERRIQRPNYTTT